MLAVVAALVISIAGFILLAFVMPATVMGAIHPWADRRVESGAFFVVTVPPIGLMSLVALCVFTRAFYVRLSPRHARAHEYVSRDA